MLSSTYENDVNLQYRLQTTSLGECQLCHGVHGHAHGVWQHTFLETWWWGSSLGGGWVTDLQKDLTRNLVLSTPAPQTSIPDGTWGTWLSGETLHIALRHTYELDNQYSLVWDVIEGLRRERNLWCLRQWYGQNSYVNSLHPFLGVSCSFGRKQLFLPNLPKYGANVNLTKHLIIAFW